MHCAANIHSTGLAWAAQASSCQSKWSPAGSQHCCSLHKTSTDRHQHSYADARLTILPANVSHLNCSTACYHGQTDSHTGMR
jgi:hypothetical protein